MTLKGCASFLFALLGVVGIAFSPLSAHAADYVSRKCLKVADLRDVGRGVGTREENRDMQFLLFDLGYFPADVKESDINGGIGTITRAAVARFQRDRNLEETGSVGPRTAEYMSAISCGKPEPKESRSDAGVRVATQTSETKPVVSAKKPPATFQTKDSSLAVNVKPKASPSNIIRTSPVAVREAVPRMEVVNARTGQRAVGRSEWWITGESASTITASPGDRLVYTLSLDGIDEQTGYGGSSTYTVDSNVSCHGEVITGRNPHPWYFADPEHRASFRIVNGSWRATTDGVVDPCQQGRTYVITLGAGNIGGNYNYSSVEIIVTKDTTSAAPKILYPNGGEELGPDDNRYVRWDTGGFSGPFDFSVQSTRSGAVHRIKSNVTVEKNVGLIDRIDWNYPEYWEESPFVAIVCRSGTSLCDVSDNSFTISPRSTSAPIELYANGKTRDDVVYVKPGEQIKYELRVDGPVPALSPDSWSSYYEVTEGDSHCGGPVRGAWVPPVLGGWRSDKAEQCQVGNTYRITYSYNKTGQMFDLDPTYVTIKVIPSASTSPTALPGARTSASDTNSAPVTAQFTVNDATSITVSPGDTVRYRWSSTGGSRFVSNFFSDQASCGAGASGPWYANAASGERSDIVQDCQAGRTYTISYDVSNATGQTVHKTVTVRVLSLTQSRPTATFTANGSQDITVNVGDTVNYLWSSTGGRSYVSNVIADQPSCGGPANTSWHANGTAGGQRADTVGECQAGRTYTIAYDVITGVQSAHAQVIVRVRPATQSRPTASFTANGADDITVNIGDPVTYTWSSTAASGASSRWSSDQASCGAGAGGSWSANTTSGSRTDTVGECQAGRTYTITYVASNTASLTTEKSVTVRVRPVVRFTANGAEVTSVASSGNVTYALQVLPADAAARITNAYATYTREQADACGPVGETGPWTPPPLNGSRTDTASGCQAGGGYRITYRYTLDGRTEERSVLVSIRSTSALRNIGSLVLGSVYQGMNRLFGNGRLGN